MKFPVILPLKYIIYKWALWYPCLQRLSDMCTVLIKPLAHPNYPVIVDQTPA